jgi:hypothetical protein
MSAVPPYYSVHQVWCTTVAVQNLAITNKQPATHTYKAQIAHARPQEGVMCNNKPTCEGLACASNKIKGVCSATSWHVGPISYFHAILTLISAAGTLEPLGACPLLPTLSMHRGHVHSKRKGLCAKKHPPMRDLHVQAAEGATVSQARCLPVPMD